MTENETNKPGAARVRVPTLTRKDIEMKIDEKLYGKRITRKLVVDSLFETLRELIMTANPIIRIEIRDFGVFEVKKTKPKPKARNLKTGDLYMYRAEEKCRELTYLRIQHPLNKIFLNLFFQSAYAWRTYFLLHSGEDYIELGKAKGLNNNLLERRYLLRPALPYIMTSLAMILVGTWQNALILEKFFFWPGIGGLFFDSINNFRITASIIIVFAYLLVITVFILDVLYAVVDPRVRLGGSENYSESMRLGIPLRVWIKTLFTNRSKKLLKRPIYSLPQLSQEQPRHCPAGSIRTRGPRR